MKTNYLIIHGSFASPFSNWIPYLRKEIEKKGFEVYNPDLPSGTDYQNYNNWASMMKSYQHAGILNENTIIFAHSIAPVFICKYLINNHLPIKRLVCVSGFNNFYSGNPDFDSVNESMYLDNLSEVKEYCKEIICLYSDNDPYVSFDVEKTFADKIADKQVLIKNGGHLNSESGYVEFPQLKKYI